MWISIHSILSLCYLSDVDDPIVPLIAIDVVYYKSLFRMPSVVHEEGYLMCSIHIIVNADLYVEIISGPYSLSKNCAIVASTGILVQRYKVSRLWIISHEFIKPL